MDTADGGGFFPLSASTIHAPRESKEAEPEAAFSNLHRYPWTTVLSTSLFNTSHSNSLMNMSPIGREKEPDTIPREFLDEHVGFVCASHSEDSYEDGKSGCLAMDVKLGSCLIVSTPEYKEWEEGMQQV